MNRWRAFALHLLLSVLVIGVIALGLFYIWYPPHLLGFAKAGELFALIAGVDVVAGPLLTLIVYKAGKKSLKFDLTVIGLLQALFLAYGVHTAWVSRPVFIVGAIDRFQVVFANEIAAEELAEARPPYDRLPWFGADLVGASLPDDPEQRSRALDLMLAGRDIDKRPSVYSPFEAVAPGLLQRSMSLAQALADLPEKEAELRRLIEQGSTLRVLLITSSRGVAHMLVDAESARPVQLL